MCAIFGTLLANLWWNQLHMLVMVNFQIKLKWTQQPKTKKENKTKTHTKHDWLFLLCSCTYVNDSNNKYWNRLNWKLHFLVFAVILPGANDRERETMKRMGSDRKKKRWKSEKKKKNKWRQRMLVCHTELTCENSNCDRWPYDAIPLQN